MKECSRAVLQSFFIPAPYRRPPVVNCQRIFVKSINLCSLRPFGIFLHFHFPRSLKLGWCCQHSRRGPDHSGESSSHSPGHTQHSFDTPWWDNAHSFSVCPLQSAQFDLINVYWNVFPFLLIYVKSITLVIMRIHTQKIHYFWKIRNLPDHLQ